MGAKMPDKNKDNSQQKSSQGAQKPFKDLEARKEDTKNVKGGRARQEDPCAGGE